VDARWIERRGEVESHPVVRVQFPSTYYCLESKLTMASRISAWKMLVAGYRHFQLTSKQGGLPLVQRLRWAYRYMTSGHSLTSEGTP